MASEPPTQAPEQKVGEEQGPPGLQMSRGERAPPEQLAWVSPGDHIPHAPSRPVPQLTPWPTPLLCLQLR